MSRFQSLENYLKDEVSAERSTPATSATITAITDAAKSISALVRRGSIGGELGATRGDNADGDVQKELDVVANDMIIEALEHAPVAWLVSEELEEPLRGIADAPLIVAIDPLDGSSNINTNTAVGTIFSIYPRDTASSQSAAAATLQPGVNQVAAGYVIYGPQTLLVLTTGNGSNIFTMDPDDGTFRLTESDIQIAETTREFAINVSNFRHWDRPIRTYIDDCLNGEEGHSNSNYNMRWLASLVAECHRIFSRGGIFLYPSDARQGYAAGRLRLLYECNPIAFLVEQAGGAATTGTQRILEVMPENVHQRIPMIFGSKREIARVERYFSDAELTGNRSQLFNNRGLFRS